MADYTSSKQLHIAGAVVLLAGLWFILSVFNEPLVIPPMSAVFAELWKILTHAETLFDIFITLGRLVCAMLISIIGGVSLGIFGAVLFPYTLKEILKEALKILQIIPPVAVLIMAMMWFGLNGIPAIFIVTVSLIPLIAIQVIDAIDNIDSSLVDMGKVFKTSRWDMLRRIYIPSIEPAMWSSIIVSLTMGAKIIVMGEVLTTNTGIGGQITIARLNIEPETVIAWTIIAMLLYYTLEFFINLVKDRKRFEQKNYFD